MGYRAIELEWQGNTFVIPENRAFEVADEVEDVVPLGEFAEVVRRMQSRKIATCYAIMLNCAGVPVTRDDVFREMITNMTENQIPAAQAFAAAIHGLAEVLTNGMDLPDASEGGDAGKKSNGSSAPLTNGQ